LLGKADEVGQAPAVVEGAAYVYAAGLQLVAGSVAQFEDGLPSTILVTTGCTKTGIGLLVTPAALAET